MNNMTREELSVYFKKEDNLFNYEKDIYETANDELADKDTILAYLCDDDYVEDPIYFDLITDIFIKLKLTKRQLIEVDIIHVNNVIDKIWNDCDKFIKKTIKEYIINIL